MCELLPLIWTWTVTEVLMRHTIDAMTIVFTTIAFALQLSSIPWALGDYAHWQLQTIRTGAILISALYIFELVFRFNMRWPL